MEQICDVQRPKIIKSPSGVHYELIENKTFATGGFGDIFIAKQVRTEV
jgi:hypothetical protein